MSARVLRRKLTNAVFVAATALATAIALTALGFIFWSLFKQGIGGIDLDVFTKTTPAPGSVGGLANAILGSLKMCIAGMAIAMVVGVLAGTWLAEIGGDTPYGHAVRFLNDVLLSAPSILVGLAVYTIVVAPSWSPVRGFSGWAGAIALALLAAPIVTRTTEDILNLQPHTLREAGMALGASQSVTVRKIVWRAAGAGLMTGGLLAFARISGETAPLLFTALNNQFFSKMSDATASLPVVIYNYAMSAYDDWRSLAWAGALLIAMTVLIVNITGRVLARTAKR
jgi:phosphate transport system permease protein